MGLLPQELPEFRSLVPKERLRHLQMIDDPGIEEILALIFREKSQRLSPADLLAHPNLAVWLAFLSAGELMPGLVYTFSCLQTGLRFRDKLVRARSLEGMLNLSTEKQLSELYENLHSFKVIGLFLEVASEYPNWEPNPELLLSAIKVVNLIIANNAAFAQSIQQLGFLGVVELGLRLVRDDLESELKASLIEFVGHYLHNNTLTVLQTLYETWEVKGMLQSGECHQNDAFFGFIQRTLPLYGSQAVKLMLKLYRSHVLTEASELLQALVEVPYYFKVSESEEILSVLGELTSRLENWKPDSKFSGLKCLVSNLTDLLVAPKWYEFAHLTGVCTNFKYANGLLDAIGKHPMLFFCCQCQKALCCVCLASAEHAQHAHQFLGYQKDYYCCSTKETQNMDLSFDFVFNWSGTKISTYIDTVQNVKYIDTINLMHDGVLDLRTEHPLCYLEDIGDEVTAAYFEVYLIQGGTKDGVTLGLGDEKDPILTFCGIDGHIRTKGRFLRTGPKFGSYDTVGVGMSSKGNGFVTYNGLLLHPMFPVNFHDQNAFGFIRLEGAGTLVSPQCSKNNWKFRPDLLSKDIANGLKIEGVKPATAERVFRIVVRLARSLDRWNSRADLQQKIGAEVGMAMEFLKAFHREDLLAVPRDAGGVLSNKLCSPDKCVQF